MYNFTVQNNTLITPTVRLITLVPATHGDSLFAYKAGQYVAISLRDKSRPTATRCFSLTSSPAQGDSIQIGIRVKGKFTSALERLRNGDWVTVQGPFGNFVLSDTHASVTFFAGGIGITPFVSILRYISDRNINTPIHLVYSCKNENDIPFFDELLSLERDNQNIDITYVIGSGKVERLKDRRVITNKLNSTILDTLRINYNVEKFMVCGPTQYMHSVQTLLKEKGVSETKIQTESFNQGPSLKNRNLLYWPANMYAMTGIFFTISTGLIVATDLNKTLPKIKIRQEVPSVETNSIHITNDKSLLEIINSIEPQVDTNLTQEPIITYIPNPLNNRSPVPAQTPVTKTTPVPVVATKPETKTVVKEVIVPAQKPTPVVQPKDPPRSTIS